MKYYYIYQVTIKKFLFKPCDLKENNSIRLLKLEKNNNLFDSTLKCFAKVFYSKNNFFKKINFMGLSYFFNLFL